MPIKLHLKTPLRTTNALVMFVVVLITRFKHDVDGFRVSGIHMQFSLFIFHFLLFISNRCIMMSPAEKDKIRLILQRFRNTSKNIVSLLSEDQCNKPVHLPSVCTDKTDVL